MKFLFKLILFLTIASVVCMVTLPERGAHLRSVAGAIVDEVESGELFPGLKNTRIVSQVADTAYVRECLDKVLVVDDYALFSVGKVLWLNKEYVVSLGVLGKVFNFSDAKAAEDFISEVEDTLEDKL